MPIPPDPKAILKQLVELKRQAALVVFPRSAAQTPWDDAMGSLDDAHALMQQAADYEESSLDFWGAYDDWRRDQREAV